MNGAQVMLTRRPHCLPGLEHDPTKLAIRQARSSDHWIRHSVSASGFSVVGLRSLYVLRVGSPDVLGSLMVGVVG